MGWLPWDLGLALDKFPWCQGQKKLPLLTPPPGGSESWTGRRICCATQRTWPNFSPRKCWLSAETKSQIPHSLKELAPALPRMSKNRSSASKAETPSPSRSQGPRPDGPTEGRRSLSTARPDMSGAEVSHLEERPLLPVSRSGESKLGPPKSLCN